MIVGNQISDNGIFKISTTTKKLVKEKLHMYLSVDPVDAAALGIYSV